MSTLTMPMVKVFDHAHGHGMVGRTYYHYIVGSGYVAEHFRSSNFAFPQVFHLGLELGLVIRVRFRVRFMSRG